MSDTVALSTESTSNDVGSGTADKVVSSSMRLIVRRAAVLLATGVSTAVVARVLQPGDYGTLQSAMAAWAIVLALADFGFSLVMLRDLAEAPEQRPHRLRTAYEVQSLWCLVVTAALVAGAVWRAQHSDQGLVLLVLAPSVLATAVAAGRALHMSMFETGRLMRIDITVNVVQNALLVAVALAGGGIVALASVVSGGTVVNALWVGRSARRRVGRGRVAAGARLALFRRVVPLGMMGIISKIYLSIDLVILGFLVQAQALGDYAGAVKIINLLNTIPAILVGMVLPGVAGVWADREATIVLLRRMLQWIMVVLVPIFGAAALWPSLPVNVALGTDYDGALVLVTILAFSGLIAVFAQLFGSVLVTAQIIRPMIIQNVAAVIVNVAGNLFLVPIYGVSAAAWLTVTTEAIVCLGSLWTLRRVLPLREVFADAGRPVAALTVTALVGVLTREHLWLSVPLTLLTLIALVEALRCGPPEISLRRKFS